MKNWLLTLLSSLGIAALVLVTALLVQQLLTQREKVKEPVDLSAGEPVILPIGYISGLEGNAYALNEIGQKKALEVGSRVYLQEELVTEPESRLQVTLEDESVIRMGASSRMAVSAFVFTTHRPGKNACSVVLEQGTFRMITKKITDLNPEGFRVKTRSATIGIRGCDLGFFLSPGTEAIYMLAISANRSVVVESDKIITTDKASGRTSRIEVLEEGTVVYVHPEDGLSSKPIPENERASILRDTDVFAVNQTTDEESDGVRLFSYINTATGDAGDIITHNIQLRMDPSSDFFAEDVEVTSTFAEGLSFTGNVTRINGPLPTTQTSTVNKVEFLVNGLSPEVPQVEFSFESLIAENVKPHSVISNGSSVVWTKRLSDGTIAGTFTNNVDHSLSIKPPTVLLLQVASEDPDLVRTLAFDPKLPEFKISEKVIYYISTSLTEGYMPIKITSQMPIIDDQDPIFIDTVALQYMGGNLKAEHYPPRVEISDADGDGIADTTIIDFGEVQNPGDNVYNQAEQIIIKITGIITEIPANQHGAKWLNTAKLDYGGVETLTDVAEVEIYRPVLDFHPFTFKFYDLDKGLPQDIIDTGIPRETLEDWYETTRLLQHDFEVLILEPDNDPPTVIYQPPSPPDIQDDNDDNDDNDNDGNPPVVPPPDDDDPPPIPDIPDIPTTP